jgi:hypothetical protein
MPSALEGVLNEHRIYELISLSMNKGELSVLIVEETPGHVTSLASFDFPRPRNDAGDA